MFIGATNMTLVYFCFNGNVKKLIKDEEFRWFFFFVLSAIIVVMVWILYLGFASDVENAFRKAAFQVVTLVSTCGFATDDYIPWGPFFLVYRIDLDVYLWMRRIYLRWLEDGTLRYFNEESLQ